MSMTNYYLLVLVISIWYESNDHFMTWYLVIYTDLQPIALAQAVGFEHPKNPLS